MNLIKFSKKTLEEGSAFFSIPLGIECPAGILDIDESSAYSNEYTDIDSIMKQVREYILNNIDTLVDQENYLCSYRANGRIYLYISKLKP